MDTVGKDFTSQTSKYVYLFVRVYVLYVRVRVRVFTDIRIFQ